VTAGLVVAGRYTIEGSPRAGGMGTVYRAVDQQSGRPVAVKLLDVSDPASTARFAREASALARLSHPSIVTYVDHGRHRGRSYLVMEWLEGRSLAEAMAGGLAPADTIRIGAAAAAALAHAHAAGLVHRDVKPENLVLDDRGGLKVVDFGIAHWAGGRVRFTETGSVVGTPGYMSPEQARGARAIDGRADVFALGCVLYECLCGCPAFAGENAPATLIKIALDDPIPIRERSPDLPDELARLVEAMLRKDPAQRPPASEVALELLEVAPRAGGLPVVAPWVSQETEVRAAPRCVLVGAPSPDRSPEWSPDEEAEAAELLAATDGATVDRLIDGALLVTMTRPGDLAERARAAVQLALDLAARLPGFLFALSTDRQRGDAVDRAGRVLLEAVMEQAAGDSGPPGGGGVLVDSGTATLLGDGFAIETGPRYARARARARR